jgi:hypothetical protein
MGPFAMHEVPGWTIEMIIAEAERRQHEERGPV